MTISENDKRIPEARLPNELKKEELEKALVRVRAGKRALKVVQGCLTEVECHLNDVFVLEGNWDGLSEAVAALAFCKDVTDHLNEVEKHVRAAADLPPF